MNGTEGLNGLVLPREERRLEANRELLLLSELRKVGESMMGWDEELQREYRV